MFVNNSYTSGARDTSPSIPAIRTAASESRVITQEPISTHNTSSRSWILWASDQLDAIAKLEPDWDSYGADRPSPRAIANASALLLIVHESFSTRIREQSQPQIVAPRPDGAIQIEWGRRPFEMAVHADPSGTLGYLSIDQRGDTFEFKEVQNATWEEVIQKIATVVYAVPG